MSYKKRTGDNSQANEYATIQGNHIQIFNDGSGKIIVCFLMLLATAAIVYLWLTLHILLVVVMIGSLVVLSVVGISATWRHVSNTRKEHLVNEAEIEWSKILYQTDNLVATLNRSTREVTVHNAQQVSIQHHHAAPQTMISEVAESKSYMPKLSDLNKEESNGKV